MDRPETKISLTKEPEQESFGSLPDLRYIKSRIPILHVARELGIRTELPGALWARGHCFRPENHKNGDRTPSLNFQTKKNKYMCFACDDRLHSNVDLVMAVEGYTLQQAIDWFEEHYPGIPRIKAKLNPGWESVEFRAGVNDFRTPEDLVRAGLVPHLTDSSLRVFTVLAAFRDKSDVSQISYETIKLRSGIASNHTVAKAITHLEGLSLLEKRPQYSRRKAGIGGKAVSQYVFTFDDPELFNLLSSRTPKTEGVKCRE